MAPNLALISIPAYYVLCLAPHMYGALKATGGDTSKYDAASPRSSSGKDKLRQAASPEDYATYERATAAHANGLENMPLYVAAVFAGLLAEVGTKGTIGKTYVSSSVPTGLERFVYSWFAVRVLYTGAYIGISTQDYAPIRTALYFIGTGLCFEQIVRAAIVLGS